MAPNHCFGVFAEKQRHIHEYKPMAEVCSRYEWACYCMCNLQNSRDWCDEFFQISTPITKLWNFGIDFWRPFKGVFCGDCLFRAKKTQQHLRGKGLKYLEVTDTSILKCVCPEIGYPKLLIGLSNFIITFPMKARLEGVCPKSGQTTLGKKCLLETP